VTQSSSEQIQALFNRIAPVYDQLNDWLSLGQHRIWKQMTVKWSGAVPGANCLDVCCGSGDLTQLLARQVGSTGQVIGVDFAATQLAIAHERASCSLQPLPITWVEGDALNLPFEANQFDAATMGYGLRNVVDILGSLRELYRVLKPGAKVAILDFHKPSQAWLQACQQWYLQTVVVRVAQHFNLTEDYAYISPSLDRFPVGYEQVQLAKQAGFDDAVHYAIAHGLMGVLVARKG
jgi:demethylmenaquinone methyltransferase/2-methoxy-6-polyprenyl-1,4-benzoquinol methylase